jgi:phosphoenolpyruvate carboxykinase (GTP)
MKMANGYGLVGDNIRVLKWILNAAGGTVEARPTGYLPGIDSIDIKGLENQEIKLSRLLLVDKDLWREEIALIKEHFALFGDRLPNELKDQLIALENRFL